MLQPSLGERLRTARIARGFDKPGQAANRFGCDRTTIIRAETCNARNWSLLKLVQIASIYRISLSDLLGYNYKPLPKMMGRQILLVDDEKTQRLIYERHLLTALPGITVASVDSGQQALAWMQHNQAKLIIADYRMPGINGGELIGRLNQSELNKHAISILMTDKMEVSAIREIAKRENSLYFDKREPKDVFIALVADALRVV